MRKQYCLVLFLFLSCFNASAQNTTEKFYNWQWKPCEPAEARFYSVILETDSGFIRQDYYVHERSLQMSGKFRDKNTDIPNGHFRYFHPNGNLESQGQYINGKKNGLWLSYHSNGMMEDSSVYQDGNVSGTQLGWHSNGFISDSSVHSADGSGVSVGWFDNGSPSWAGRLSAGGRRQGKWVFYHKNGQKSAVEIYDLGIRTSQAFFDEEGRELGENGLPDTRASFGNNEKAWDKFMNKNIYFPNQFKFTNGDKAIVVITYTIDEDGKVTDPWVSTPFYPDFDKIALNAIRRSPKWKPAVSHNRRIKVEMRQAVNFIQESN